MKKRERIEHIIKVVNDGGDQFSYLEALETYAEVCADLYQKMMRSLNSIKILRSEIEKFSKGQT